ncbi:MAG: hypothetical protein A2583_15595 [Bdellovibrionales bacterium RIFOXYD1_FULL_53_11]|nr:MAG: hypothetical protein A2583_15595 [Bdellovibrionales bacterium RIFOXYD1_FULL_53_11]
MIQNLIKPEGAFEHFMAGLLSSGWIDHFTWSTGTTIQEVRTSLGGPCPKGASRTHKNAPDGIIHALQVRACANSRIGIDLEWFDELRQAPVLRKLAKRFELPTAESSIQTMEEWCRREAAYKAYCNHDKFPGIHIGNIMTMAGFEFKLSHAGNWILCFAKIQGSNQ